MTARKAPAKSAAKTPAKKAPAKKAQATKAPAKKSVPKKAAPPEGQVLPEATDDLEIRLGGRIVFLQPVTRSGYSLSFSGGNVRLKASTADAQPEAAGEFDFAQPVDAQVIAATGVDPEEEVEVNPDVNLQVHTGDRTDE